MSDDEKPDYVQDILRLKVKPIPIAFQPSELLAICDNKTYVYVEPKEPLTVTKDPLVRIAEALAKRETE